MSIFGKIREGLRQQNIVLPIIIIEFILILVCVVLVIVSNLKMIRELDERTWYNKEFEDKLKEERRGLDKEIGERFTAQTESFKKTFEELKAEKDKVKTLTENIGSKEKVEGKAVNAEKSKI